VHRASFRFLCLFHDILIPNQHQTDGAGSPFTILDTGDRMDLTADQWPLYDEQQHLMQRQRQPPSFQISPLGRLSGKTQISSDIRLTIDTGHVSQSSTNWPRANNGYSLPTYQQHWSVSTHSSSSSHSRCSNLSDHSYLQNRASTVSTDSSWSSNSNPTRSYHLSQAEYSLTGQPSAFASYAPIVNEAPPPQGPRKRITARASVPEKDYYKTCVSRKQRARRAETARKYFCTICREPFVEKADWKRHEETYQERPEEFQCDICHAKYFLDKDFVTHHVQAHGCVHCNASTKSSQKRHVLASRRRRKTRTGWGCGFCIHFSTNWTERCNHVAHHFEIDGKKIEDWNHSNVIYSLLQRPAILKEWDAILERKKRGYIGFGWDAQSTARVEGYPDSTQKLQLQDALEYFTPEQDAAVLARKAYDSAVAKVDRQLSDVAPPVPPKPKDYRVKPKPSLHDIMKETESLTQFVQSIVHDDYLPTGVTHLESGALNDNSSSWFDDSY
jgi:hypothetical protein